MVIEHNNVDYKIKPSHFLCGHDLPTKALEHEFSSKWMSIFSMMEDGSKLTMPVEVNKASVQSLIIVSSE
jgi:hypothetical protein